MARYDHGYGYDREMRRPRGFSERGVSQSPAYGRGPTLDPNYQGGGYRGMRMEPGSPGQSSYGWYRATHAGDLGDAGGFDGRYGERWGHGRGRWDGEGLYHEEFDAQRQRAWNGNRDMGRPAESPRMAGGQGWPRYDDEHRGPWDGGVRRDPRHLHQYNEHSVAFRHGSEHDRGFGWAEPPRQGMGADRRPGAENRYGGRNEGGFSEMQRPRQASR
jgi:hypothetical protein